MVRAFRVFNAAQLQGWEPPVIAHQGEAVRFQAADVFVTNTHTDIRHGGRGAFYLPAEDRISMPNREAYYGTLLHELGHWTGHPSWIEHERRAMVGA